MKKKLIIFLAFFPLWLCAQCYDCSSEEPVISVGATLFNNMLYAPEWQKNQPFELNIRYHIPGRHTIRLSAPFVLKHDIPEEPNYGYNFEPLLEQYVEKMLAEDPSQYYNVFYRTLKSYYSLYGISLGYDYTFLVAGNLSVFGGVDLGYYYKKIPREFYSLVNTVNNGEGNTEPAFFSLEKSIKNTQHYTFSAKPQLGLRYVFRELTFEGALSYYLAYNFVDIKGIDQVWFGIEGYDTLDYHYTNRFFFPEYNTFNRIVYDIRLFYNF